MRPIALPFTKTVLLPAANELAWVSGIDGQVCAAIRHLVDALAYRYRTHQNCPC